MKDDYILLSEDEARGHRRLWELYSEELSKIRRDQRGFIKMELDEVLTRLVSIAADTCLNCHDYAVGCQCWNDD